MRFGLKLLGAVLLALALLQALLSYQASRRAERIAQALQPVVMLEYGGSHAWLDGRAGLEDVRVHSPLLAEGSISASAVELDVGGPLALLALLWRDEGEPPRQLAIRVRGLRMDAALERRVRDAASRQGYLAPFEALGCNDRGRFDGVDYAELGWLQSVADLELRWRAPASGAWSFALAYDMAPLGRTDLSVEFDAPAGASLSPALAATMRPRRFEARFDDRGMLARRNAYCARRIGVAEDAFLDRHLAAVAGELEAMGMFPDPPVLALYREFARRGGVLSLTMTPGATVPMSQYHHYAPADQLGLLAPVLRLDQGEPVPVTARFFSAGADAGAGAAVDTVRVQVDASAADQLTADELPGLVGRRLAVKTREGQAYVGTFLGLQGPLLRLEIVQRGGTSQRLAVRLGSIETMRLAD